MAGITRKRLEAVCIGTVLVLAAFLRLWRLEANGFGTEYYAAGVRSALQGGALLFYNSFDPAGFLSLDKPPVAFWIQAAFAKVLGFSGWTIHLPQALAGVASVALLYRLVRRPFGIAAATIAALLLALTPIAVAIDRSNNTDSWLVFFLLLFFANKYRHGSSADRSGTTKKTWRFEVAWTAATLLIFVGLAVWGADIYLHLYNPPPGAL